MTFNEYQEKILETWQSNKKDLERILFGIAGESGELLEYFKKFYRGDYNNKTINLVKIDTEIGDTLYYLAMLCNKIGIKLDTSADMNIKKLTDKQRRNKLKGEGDNR